MHNRVYGGIDEIDIFINIDLNTFLDEHMPSAWGVNESQPLVILLHILSISNYLEGLEPKVTVFQVKDDVAPTASAYDGSTKRRKIGICSQLEKILQTFVSKQWRKISLSTVDRAMSGETPSSKTPGTCHTVDQREDAKLAKLVEMGFGAEEASEALHQCWGDVEAACELLVTTPSGPFSSGGGSGFLSSLVSFLPGYTRQDSMGAQLEVTEHHDPEGDKRTPSLEKGFLVQVVRYALNRLKSLNKFCVICDEKHVLESGLIKPCVCTRDLCVFAFQTLGVMADGAEAIASDRDEDCVHLLM
ncbi:Protein mono-ADP-ribosyltransferase PARP6 [Geodia barretti]|uniref:Protein mono-ADP-ribosyltransferase PARP6 n=1 Tax=Geodia barretti TaxID=519541 RepID=A0AA35TSE1_GEOBA|nr:Protein mono-ADP-ribosyltransferase PARP6 [Geodia barretti]